MQYKHLNLDYKLRTKIKKKELNQFLFKFLAQNKNIINKQKIRNILNVTHQNFCKGRTKNICQISGLNKSVISKFTTSRHFFRKRASERYYPGIRKAS